MQIIEERKENPYKNYKVGIIKLSDNKTLKWILKLEREKPKSIEWFGDNNISKEDMENAKSKLVSFFIKK